MKLAKVNHNQCNEYAATTYIMIPDEWDEETFRENVDKAAKDYQNFVNNWNEERKKYIEASNFSPYGYPDYKKHPDKTVAEIDALHAQKAAQYDEWKNFRQQGYKTFGDYLKKYGCISLWEYEGIYTRTVYHGHQHGAGLDYENTLDDDRAKDLPGPLKHE